MKVPKPIKSPVQIEEAVSRFQSVKHARFLRPTAPVFFGLWREQLGQRADEALPIVGEEFGISMGNSFMDLLISAGRIPFTTDIAMQLLCRYHTDIQWGTFSYQRESPEHLQVKVESSFLTLETDKNRHLYCPFLQGYLSGLLWIVLRERYRWFRNVFSATPDEPLLKPTKVVEKKDDACLFLIEMSPEELSQAFDALFDSKEKLRAGAYFEALALVRTSLETGFKTRVSIPRSSRVSFFSLIDAYKKAMIPNDTLDYTKAGKIYEAASVAIHDISMQVQGNKILDRINEAERILRVLDSFTIGRRYRERIYVEVGVTYSSFETT
jgi:hypothetical protein